MLAWNSKPALVEKSTLGGSSGYLVGRRWDGGGWHTFAIAHCTLHLNGNKHILYTKWQYTCPSWKWLLSPLNSYSSGIWRTNLNMPLRYILFRKKITPCHPGYSERSYVYNVWGRGTEIMLTMYEALRLMTYFVGCPLRGRRTHLPAPDHVDVCLRKNKHNEETDEYEDEKPEEGE